MQISEELAVEDSADYVLISVEISDASRTTPLQSLQARALTQVIATLSGIASDLELKLHSVASNQ